MIIRATFRNIFSFNEETSISFVAGKGTTKPEHVDRAEGRDDISILKAGVIYGANASGKSNLVKSINILREIIEKGVNATMYKPFKLDENIGKPSKIELEFRIGNKYYAYGIEYDSKIIHEEWLYEINKRTDKLVFSRSIENGKNKYEFGQQLPKDPYIFQFINFLSEGTPWNNCFLMEYIRRNGRGFDCIIDVFKWFSALTIVFPFSKIKGLSFRLQDKNFNKRFNEFLKYFNTGIQEVKLISVKKGDINLPSYYVENIENSLENNSGTIVGDSPVDSYYFEKDFTGKLNAFKLQTIHKAENGEEVPFELADESDGTIRLFDFIPILIALSDINLVILIDELDRSMHTMLTKEIFKIYSKLLKSKNIQSQFICTTHESNLLSLESLREDEIWFAEKDETGSTHFTSLCEFEHRDNNKQKGYLNGRYGAIPFYGDINNIIND